VRGHLPRQMVHHIQRNQQPISMLPAINHPTIISATSVSIPTNKSPVKQDSVNSQLVQGYAEMVTDRVNDGWSCHLLTFMFSQLPGLRYAVIAQMKDEIHRVYSIFLTRVHRKPRTASPDELPVMIAVADLPVYKRYRSSWPIVRCNDGLHFHVLLLTPAKSRLVESVDEHFSSNLSLYLGQHRLVSSINVRPVNADHGYVVEYVFKTFLRERVTYDDGVLILPRAVSELGPRKSLICQKRTLEPSSGHVH
jgi:hypothetical protein